MPSQTRPLTRALAGALLSLLPTACLAVAPPASLRSEAALVRADTDAEAALVSDLVADLRPRLLDLLPDSKLDSDVEIWIQDEPSLYAFPASASGDAEGLYSQDHGRILLARDAEDIERTLAHEMTHAALGPSWRALPGTLEEGLCDLVSAHLCERGATRLRAGRLCSAALAAGGLRLRLELRERNGDEARVLWTTRLVLSPREKTTGGVMEVFRLQAGLSSTRIAAGSKRGYYGLAYLLVARIVERHGLEGLNQLCTESLRGGYGHVPVAWMLEAAELDRDDRTWRVAAAEALGRAELSDLLRIYPDVIAGAIDELELAFGPALREREDLELWAVPEEGRVEVELRLPKPVAPPFERVVDAR